MKKYRIIFACILAALCLAACQRKAQEAIELSDEDSTYSSRYSRETVDTDPLPCIVRMCLSPNYLYTLGYSREEAHDTVRTLLYRMELAAGGFEEVDYEISEDAYVYAMCSIPQSDDFYLLLGLKNEDGDPKDYYLKRLNAQGETIESVDITETFSALPGEGFAGEMAVDKDGNYYFRIPAEIVVCNPEGKVVRRIQENGFILGFTYDNDMNLFYAYMNMDNGGTLLNHIEDGKLEGSFVAGELWIYALAETRNGVMLETEKGIWRLTNGAAEQVFDFAKEGIDYELVQNCCIAPDGSVYLHLCDYASAGNEWVLYRFAADGEGVSAREARTTICLAGRSLGGDVKKAAASFNMAQDSIFVETKEYGEDDAGEKKLLLDIASSDTIDILCVQNRCELKKPERYLQNIYPLIAEAGVTDNIMRAFCEGETAYFITPGYMLHTMFLKGQYNADSVTLEAFKGLQEDRQGRNILYGMDRHAFFAQVMRTNMRSILQEKEGTIDIDRLHEISQVSMAVSGGEEDDSLPSQLRDGACMGAIVDLCAPSDYIVYLEMMEGEGSYVGLPVAENGCSGSTIFPMSGLYGIVSQSAHPKEAQEFIRYLLGEAYQNGSCYPYQFPVSEKALDRVFQIVSADRDMILEDGEKITPYSLDVGYGEYEVTLDAFTQEETAGLRKLIDSADYIYEVDPVLSDMILEEMEQYFTGAKDLESVDAILTERLQTYLAE